MCTFSQGTFFTLLCSNKLRRKIRNKDVSRVSTSSSTNLLINLEKSRIRNQTLLKVCYGTYFIWKHICGGGRKNSLRKLRKLFVAELKFKKN